MRHQPATDMPMGVVLCPALGREARWTYRSASANLADRLCRRRVADAAVRLSRAAATPPTYRAMSALAAWRDSVHAAVDWLRAHTGLKQVALAGLRLGAMLAGRDGGGARRLSRQSPYWRQSCPGAPMPAN